MHDPDSIGVKVANGEIVGWAADHIVVRLNDGTEIKACIPKDRKFGCLFGGLIGWQVRVVFRKPPRLAHIVELRRA